MTKRKRKDVLNLGSYANLPMKGRNPASTLEKTWMCKKGAENASPKKFHCQIMLLHYKYIMYFGLSIPCNHNSLERSSAFCCTRVRSECAGVRCVGSGRSHLCHDYVNMTKTYEAYLSRTRIYPKLFELLLH
jgi:hypothetical protein